MHSSLALLGAALVVVVASIQVPPDFALSFEGDLCSGAGIDTAAGTYTREINPGQKTTARFALDAVQLRLLFDMAVRANLLSYPEEFSSPDDRAVLPASRYVITMRSGGKQHTVRWTDQHSSTPEAVRLRTFVNDVYAYFLAIPEVARLPKQETFCL